MNRRRVGYKHVRRSRQSQIAGDFDVEIGRIRVDDRICHDIAREPNFQNIVPVVGDRDVTRLDLFEHVHATVIRRRFVVSVCTQHQGVSDPVERARVQTAPKEFIGRLVLKPLRVDPRAVDLFENIVRGAGVRTDGDSIPGVVDGHVIAEQVAQRAVIFTLEFGDRRGFPHARRRVVLVHHRVIHGSARDETRTRGVHVKTESETVVVSR